MVRKIGALLVSVALLVGGAVVGASAASAATTTQLQAYITRVYSDLFDRAPDGPGLTYWTGKLQSGTPYGEVANGITYSAEYRSGMIREAYRTYLDRDAEAAGLAGWLGAMQAGMHIEQMQGGFISSPEYYNLGGGTDSGWITRLYQKVLHRTPAGSEVDYWLGRLGTGATRYDVAMGFLYSTEHLTEVVNGYYQLLLGRSIDPAGRQTWVTNIQRGARDEQIIASIVSSAEYLASVGIGSGPAPSETPSQANARRMAADYLTYAAFSRTGLIDQLEYEGFSAADAQYGVDALGADWAAQAVRMAGDYLDTMAFSRLGLIDQLEYEGFSAADAQHGADALGADWFAQAARMAAHYLDTMPFSRAGMISQLEYEGFTAEQAQYGADAVGL